MKQIFVILFLAASFPFAACNNRDENGSTDTSNTSSTKSVTDSTRGDKPSETTAQTTTVASQESKDFATKAAGGGLMEVQLGQMAEQNAKSQRVKDFGTMMVTDHSQANEELKGIATANNITLPTALPPDLQKHYDAMSKMKGDAFDKHYIDMMVDDHKKDIGEFQEEANSTTNDAFKSFAAKTLPTLQKHLDSAQAIHGKK